MKYYLYLMLTLIFFALVGIGFLLFKSYEINKEIAKSNINKMLDETSDKIFVSGTGSAVLVQNNNYDKEPKGNVSGKICFPSESIPPLDLFVQNADTDEFALIETDLNQDSFETNLDPGYYVAYAYVKGIDDSYGAYTEMVPCGLGVGCEDHTLIEFEVVDGEITPDVDICDWYGAEVPDKPSLEQ